MKSRAAFLIFLVAVVFAAPWRLQAEQPAASAGASSASADDAHLYSDGTAPSTRAAGPMRWACLTA